MAGAAQKVSAVESFYVDSRGAASAIPNLHPRTRPETQNPTRERTAAPQTKQIERKGTLDLVATMALVSALLCTATIVFAYGNAKQEAEIHRRSALKHQLHYEYAISLQLHQAKAVANNTIYVEHQAKLAGMTIPDSRSTVIVGQDAP